MNVSERLPTQEETANVSLGDEPRRPPKRLLFVVLAAILAEIGRAHV